MQVKAPAAEGGSAGEAAAEAPAPDSTMTYRWPLFGAYTALGAGLTFGAGGHIDPSVALALVRARPLACMGFGSCLRRC